MLRLRALLPTVCLGLRRCARAWGMAGWIGLLMLVSPPGARAEPPEPPLILTASTDSVDPWAHVRTLTEEHPLTPDRIRPQDFGPPGPRPWANLGTGTQARWLRLPLRLAPEAPTDWVASIDYPSLDRVEVWLRDADGRVLHHDVLGDQLPVSQRSLPARSLATMLPLPAGQEVELLMRVETTGAHVLPLRISRMAAFHAQESAGMLRQGSFAGLMACLMLLAALAGLVTRERLYFYYAAVLAGHMGFLLALHGAGTLHLWPDWDWGTRNLAPVSSLVSIGASALFLAEVLNLREAWRRTWLTLHGVALAAATTLALFAAGLTSYHFTQAIATSLGILPMVFALPPSFRKTREGDLASRYLLIGWLLYAGAIFTLAGLLRGWVAATSWSIHAFQIGATMETLTWMLVLAIRTQEARVAVERARQERDLMHTMAHTDVLTGLRNRRGLMHALGQPPQPNVGQAVYLLDLDGFKPVNDRLGHEAGDQLLRGVAQRLGAVVRQQDVVGRLGGDEFVVLARGLRCEDDVNVVGNKLIEAFRAPFVIEGQTVPVGATIGSAWCGPGEVPDALELLRSADSAMYQGKQAGKARLVHAGALPPDNWKTEGLPGAEAEAAKVVVSPPDLARA